MKFVINRLKTHNLSNKLGTRLSKLEIKQSLSSYDARKLAKICKIIQEPGDF